VSFSHLLLALNVPLQIGKCTPGGTCTPGWEPLPYMKRFALQNKMAKQFKKSTTSLQTYRIKSCSGIATFLAYFSF